MSTQPRLDFEGYVAPRIENARVHKPGGRSVCLREGCFKERPAGAKPGEYCSSRCRREASRERARELRLHGMNIGAANNRWQRTVARWAALMCLEKRGSGIVSHVREWCDERGIVLEWGKPWTGSLFWGGWFEKTGARLGAFHEGGNFRDVLEWRLTPAGLAALEEMRK